MENVTETYLHIKLTLRLFTECSKNTVAFRGIVYKVKPDFKVKLYKIYLNFDDFAKCLFEYLLLGVKVINIQFRSLNLIKIDGFRYCWIQMFCLIVLK